MHFRCYFLDPAGHFIDVRDIEVESDANAIAAARLLAAERTDIHGFAVWQQKRQIHVEVWEDAGEISRHDKKV